MNSDATLAAQLQRLPAIVYRCRVTPEWPMVFISAGCEAITGWPPAAFLSGEVSFGELIEPEHRGRVWSVVREALDTGQPFRVNYTIRDRSGRRRWMSEQGYGVADSDGAPGLLEGLICDVTPDEDSTDALARSRHFVQRVVATMPGHVSIYDLLSHEVLYSNGPERSGLRTTRPQGPWRTRDYFLRHLHPDDHAAADRWLTGWRDVVDGEVVNWRYRIKGADGHWRWRWLRATPFERDERGAVRQVLSVSVDTTERDDAVQALADSEQRHRMIMEGASDGIFVGDQRLTIIDVNPAGCALLRMTRDELVGRNFRSFIAPDDLRKQPLRLGELHAAGSSLSERRLLRGDGTWGEFELHSRVLSDGSYLAIVRDLTARKEAEAERLTMMRDLLEGQRLESLGLISGGIAHDFNNLLTTILGSAEMALRELAADAPVRDRLEQIQLASRRASDLTRQLLDYVGKGSHEVEPVRLDALLKEIPLLIEASLGTNVRVIYEIQPALPTVQGDRGRLHQLAMNLVVNASEAIGDAAGTIHIRMHSQWLDAATIAASAPLADLEPGPYVAFEVEDSGCGMPADQIARIFEPFFSTKGTGRGLGLAAVQGIVSGHSGAMDIRSVVGGGTTVQVWLPAQSRRGRRFHSGVWATGWQGEGRVLLVDDESAVREVLSELVTALGFEVEPVAGGAAALAFLQQAPDDVAVVLLDVTMPEMDGVETWQRIAARYPELPVVFMSGMAAPDCGPPPGGASEPGFLMKPFSLETLRQALRDATGQA